MPLSENTFFWVMGVQFALLLAILLEIFRLDSKLSPISDLAKQIQGFLIRQGMLTALGREGKPKEKKAPGNPLTPEKIHERDELLGKGKESGLTEAEARHLGAILEEAARDELEKGLISPLAFLVIMAFNETFIRTLLKKDTNGQHP